MTHPQLAATLQSIDLPPLPDAAAVARADVLYELVFQVEGHSFPRLCREHASHLRQPDLFDGAPDFDDPLSL
jgi:hypothetical protein